MGVLGKTIFAKVNKQEKVSSGFTIIEVILFVSVAAMMLGGAIAGSGIAISRQRYNDSVQDFAEFMRRTYSSALFVENYRKEPLLSNDLCNIRDEAAAKAIGHGVGLITDVSGKSLRPGLVGRTNCAFYGKLVTFGEDDKNTIYTYDIVGRIRDPNIDAPRDTISAMTGRQSDGRILSDLAISPEVIGVFPDKGGNCEVKPIARSSYDLQWGAYLEKPDGSPFKGSLAIMRSPETNQLQTFFSSEVIQIANQGFPTKVTCSDFTYGSYSKASFAQLLVDDKFTEPDKGIDFCIGSHDAISIGSQRRNLRLAYRTSNPSAVELLPQDHEGNACLKK